MATALSSTASAFARENDPEFVRLAAPTTLKMVEMLLDDEPRHPGLLMTACSGFTQYAYAFLQTDAEMAEPADGPAARELTQRARSMYGRARGYCERALAAKHPGVKVDLVHAPKPLLAATRPDDVAALYWDAVAWGAELSLASNPLPRIGELVSVRLLLARAEELDEAWERGAIHEAFIALDGLPMLLGGNAARARQHFDRAVALSHGQSAFAYVALAEAVDRRAGNRSEFERQLRAALAIEDAPPELRLANLVAQKRARFLLAQAGRLFAGS